MSDVTPILTSIVDVKRFTASVIDSQVVFNSIAASRQPGRPAFIEVSVQGGVYNTGVVTINGNVSENISFSADGIKLSQNKYTTLAGLSLSGITGGVVKARTVSDMGQPINQLTLVNQNLPVRLFQNAGYMKGFEAGQQIVGSNRIRMGMMMEPDGNIQQNDYVYGDYGIVGITVMQVTFFEALYDFVGATHHIEAWLSAI